MPKICIIPNCKNNVFSHGYCKNHVNIYYQSKNPPVSKNKAITRTKSLRRISIAKTEINLQYQAIKKEKEHYLKSNNLWYCFFTNTKLEDDDLVDWHHLDGRIGKKDNIPLLIYEPWLVPVKRKWHTAWHSLTINQLKMFGWWDEFTSRLNKLSPELYEKLCQKINKSSQMDYH